MEEERDKVGMDRDREGKVEVKGKGRFGICG